MKIGILGAGFTGLAAALKLQELGHEVVIFEKEVDPGGLAGGFKRDKWDWTLEKAYHHWFTNDQAVLNLASQINYPVIIKRPLTNVLVGNKLAILDSPLTVLTFPYLPLIDRLRVGLVTFYLKYLANPQDFENQLALPWIRKYMGHRATKLIWEPLFTGKFGHFKEEISLVWFWARIKKRTTKLAYPEGGFLQFAHKLADKIIAQGGKIHYQTSVTKIKNQGQKVQVSAQGKNYRFDRLLSTLPGPLFAQLATGLPPDFSQKYFKISHLFAQNLILVLKQPLLESTYWLNITDTRFPFLVVVDHTNFQDPQHYHNEHLVYIGNYLPPEHPYLKMDKDQLLKVFDPFLKQINPNYKSSIIDSKLFTAPFAQPIVKPNYQQLIPPFLSPLPNVYLAYLDMVYPWDRGTNYAVEMGEKVAQLINQSNDQ
ncbi:NAD(P)/FAD-dependent oxidoreductase [Patescibacteria group bacterium]|nr:NAD(P)/FAD-dependent oxidoreductase [Patescibacteria group bacterium]MCL5409278.1 NAD(P)/FAD-dependent oxidoreductase [Patescibacteria group bacterium]